MKKSFLITTLLSLSFSFNLQAGSPKKQGETNNGKSIMKRSKIFREQFSSMQNGKFLKSMEQIQEDLRLSRAIEKKPKSSINARQIKKSTLNAVQRLVYKRKIIIVENQ